MDNRCCDASGSVLKLFPKSSKSSSDQWSCSVMFNSLQFHGLYSPPGSFKEFSRQEYWSGLPFPSPGDLPDPVIEPRSPALQAGTLPSKPPGKPSKRAQPKHEVLVTCAWKGITSTSGVNGVGECYPCRENILWYILHGSSQGSTWEWDGGGDSSMLCPLLAIIPIQSHTHTLKPHVLPGIASK